MMDFIANYWFIIVAVLVLGGWVAWSLYKNGPKKTLDDFREVAYQVMLVAEKKFSDGDKKFIYVVERVYELLPDPLKAIFTKNDVQKWIQTLYDDFIMDYLDDGEFNDSNVKLPG